MDSDVKDSYKILLDVLRDNLDHNWNKQSLKGIMREITVHPALVNVFEHGEGVISFDTPDSDEGDTSVIINFYPHVDDYNRIDYEDMYGTWQDGNGFYLLRVIFPSSIDTAGVRSMIRTMAKKSKVCGYDPEVRDFIDGLRELVHLVGM